MKKLILFIMAALLIGGCMKDYSLDLTDVSEELFQLKISSATISDQGDTAYVAPGIHVKFWLDSLPEPAENYSFYWSLGDGTTSVSPSPENTYEIGIYIVEVDITNEVTGQTVQRSVVLIVTNDFSFETSIVLLESTPVTGGNYSYKLGFKSTNIYNYQNTTGSRWVAGDFTNWDQQTIVETVMIDDIEYIVYYLVLPKNETERQRFGYGRGSHWAFAPNSILWVVNDQGEGAFEAYFTNGEMSPYPIASVNLPGDGGDVGQDGSPPTIRTQIVEESLRVYVNYGAYANGPNPFISERISLNNWLPVQLISIEDGWGYKDFPIEEEGQNLFFWRFGANINNPNAWGDMSNSKFYLPADNMLAIQVAQLKSGEWQVIVLK